MSSCGGGGQQLAERGHKHRQRLLLGHHQSSAVVPWASIWIQQPEPVHSAITSPQKSDAPPYMATTKQSLSSTIFVHRGSGLRTQQRKTREINIHDTARVNHKLFDSWRKLVSGKKRQKHTKKHKNTPPTILHSDKCWENWSLGTTQENAPTIIGCLLVHLSLDEKPPSILYLRKYLLGGHFHYQLPQQIS